MFGIKRRFKERKLFDTEYVPREKRKFLVIVFIFLWVTIFFWLIKTFVFSLEIIEGKSMHPSFIEGNFHIVNKYIYNFANPERENVVVIKNIWLPDQDQLIKRIIGIPGDIMEIREGDVYINGNLLDEYYVKGKTYPNIEPFRIREDIYFVMGDNREHSYDSRLFGFVRKSEIRGKLSSTKLFPLK